MTGILPSYQRFVNGVPVPSISRRAFRLREKYLIVSVLLTFGIVWLGALFYLPEFKSTSTVNDSVYSVYKRIQKAGPDLLMPSPLAQNNAGNFPVLGMDHHGSNGNDPHVIEDRNRLKAKIDEEMGMKVLERPQFDGEVAQSSSGKPGKDPVEEVVNPAPKAVSKSVAPSEPRVEGSEKKYVAVALQPGADPDVKQKLEAVKEVCSLKALCNNSMDQARLERGFV